MPGRQRPVEKLSTIVDHRANGLNLVRLVLASSVIFWHAYPLTGRPFPIPRLSQLAGDIAVDGFFAISGYLLAGSWLHKPLLLSYARNRILRIGPAFWICLVVVGFVVAPVDAALSGRPVAVLFTGPHSALHYVTDNAFLIIHFWDVAGSPDGIPYPHVWNGSLWTLRWEALAYIGLAVLGVVGALRRRWTVLALLALTWMVVIVLGVMGGRHNFYLVTGSRLGLMFLAGAVLSLYGNVIPASRRLAAAACVTIALSTFLPDYRMVGGPFLALVVIYCGGAIKRPVLQLHDRDISYGIYIYGFPVQQVLVLAGIGHLPAPVFGLVAWVSTVPIAVGSWVWIERPCLRLKNSRWPRRSKTRIPVESRRLPSSVVELRDD